MSSGELFSPVHGHIASNANQWPEARGFARMHAGNPHAQAALLESLCGMYKLASEGWHPSVTEEPADPEAAMESIAGTIRYYSAEFNDWRQPHFVLDNDFGFPDYYAEERLLDTVQWVLDRHPVPDEI
jgi:hypothetical protein